MPARAAKEENDNRSTSMKLGDLSDGDRKSAATNASALGKFGERIEDLTGRSARRHQLRNCRKHSVVFVS
jgi:hypothetical protein